MRILVGAVFLMLIAYYAFLAWRAWLWSPVWVVTETAVAAGKRVR